MQKLNVNGVDVVVDGFTGIMSKKEIAGYIVIAEKRAGDKVKSLEISDAGDGNVALKFSNPSPVKFERIRRITGYLVGTTDRFNNAKRAEEKDRVKHMKV